MKYVIILFIILIGFYGYYRPEILPGLPFFEKIEKASHNLKDTLSQSKVSLCYQLDEINWTTFTIDRRYRRIRVLSNGSFKWDFLPALDQRYWYRLHYQVLNKKQEILKDQRYYHHTGLTQYRDPETQSIINTRFYNDQSLKPGDISTIVMNLDHDTDAYYIRFKLAEKDHNMEEVIVRVYQEEKTSPQKIGYLWNRLSHDYKKQLAKGNVYPHHLMIDQEIHNVLYKKWTPLGPIGIEGKDYYVRRLYIIKEIDGERIQKEILPEGFLLDVFHHGIVSLPQQKSRIQFIFTVVDNMDHPVEKTVQLNWYGAKQGQRNEKSDSFFGDTFQLDQTYLDGLVDISVSHPLVLKVFQLKKNQRIDITPEPLKIRAYVSSINKPVSYSIHHSNHSVTPFRFDLRAFFQSEGVSKSTVSYAFLDKNNQTIKKGKIPLNETKSLYDRVTDDISGIYLTEPARYYFSLKRQVKKIQFSSTQKVLINAYNRPYRMPKITRIPEDYHQYNLKDPERQPSWFAFNPIDSRLLIQKGLSHLLMIQFRPPEIKKEFNEGKYKWEMFFPESKWRGRYLLLDWDRKKPYRHELLNTIYQKIPIGKPVNIEFKQPAIGINVTSPDVLFIKKEFQRKSLKVMIDGRLLKEYYLTGRRGEIHLPPISTEKHVLEFDTIKNTSLYINGAGPGSKNIMKRLAKRIDSKGLIFKYQKTSLEEELLMFHFFADFKQTRPITISVQVNGKKAPHLTPLKDWSLCNRQFVMTPNRTSKFSVLFTKDKYVGQGQLFFLPLGSDLVPGEYTVKITLNRNNSGYLIFSKITLGIFEKTRFFRVEGIVNDEVLE